MLWRQAAGQPVYAHWQHKIRHWRNVYILHCSYCYVNSNQSLAAAVWGDFNLFLQTLPLQCRLWLLHFTIFCMFAQPPTVLPGCGRRWQVF